MLNTIQGMIKNLFGRRNSTRMSVLTTSLNKTGEEVHDWEKMRKRTDIEGDLQLLELSVREWEEGTKR